MADFALIGAAGFVASRHMRAISDTGHRLVAALDPNDSVGVLDQFFPEAHFFTEFERFDRHVDKLRRKGTPVSYVSICSPNYLHDSHIRFSLRSGADVICEKPVVLNPWNIEALAEMERETSRRVYTVLQLRLHPAIIALREEVAKRRRADPGFKPEVQLAYITSRGRWYHVSWKGELSKSGGIATNIGIHFFDMLLWIFGEVVRNEVHISTPETASGYLELAHAHVRWFLSTDATTLPAEIAAKGQRTFRSLAMEGRAIEFSDGFTNLHTETYRHILAGHGFGLAEATPAIQLAHDIRNASPAHVRDSMHPLASKPPRST